MPRLITVPGSTCVPPNVKHNTCDTCLVNTTQLFLPVNLTKWWMHHSTSGQDARDSGTVRHLHISQQTLSVDKPLVVIYQVLKCRRHLYKGAQPISASLHSSWRQKHCQLHVFGVCHRNRESSTVYKHIFTYEQNMTFLIFVPQCGC